MIKKNGVIRNFSRTYVRTYGENNYQDLAAQIPSPATNELDQHSRHQSLQVSPHSCNSPLQNDLTAVTTKGLIPHADQLGRNKQKTAATGCSPIRNTARCTAARTSRHFVRAGPAEILSTPPAGIAQSALRIAGRIASPLNYRATGEHESGEWV